jgi:hypothetical protein
MKIRLLGALALVFAALVGARPAVAAVDDHDFAGAVPGLAGKTWVDVLSQLFPDITVTERGYATASEVIDLRSIGPGDESWVKCGDKIEFFDRDARPVRLAGRDYLIVTVMLEDDCVGPIALFDSAGKLVDAVNIKGDQHVSFTGDYVRPLGPDGALVIASLWHDNSDQSYDGTALVLARPDGFSAIGGMLALGSRSCGNSDSQEPGELVLEQGSVRVVPDGRPFARIEVEVKRSTQKLDASDCETKIGREVRTTFDGDWRWDAKKGGYQDHTRELDLLDKWNEKHF